DEVSYNFHIIARFEIEQELIEGRLEVKDMPAAFNDRIEEYLGITPPNDALGVLQDMHWAAGSMGYFPTYSLGNVMSVQIFERAHAELPELDAQFEQGEFSQLRAALRGNLDVPVR